MSIFKEGKEEENEFAIIGLGRFGGSLARRLEALEHPVLGIDIDPRAAKEISDEITGTVVLDGTDENTLGKENIYRATSIMGDSALTALEDARRWLESSKTTDPTEG